MSQTDAASTIEDLRAALENYNKQNNNELSPFHAARDNLLKTLSAAVIALGEEVLK